MFAKLVVVILALGVIACVLLTVRQQRMQAVHELANVQRQVAKLDRTLAHLRLEIAERTTPEKIAEMSRSLGPLRAIGVPEPVPAPAPAAAAPTGPTRTGSATPTRPAPAGGTPR